MGVNLDPTSNGADDLQSMTLTDLGKVMYRTNNNRNPHEPH